MGCGSVTCIQSIYIDIEQKNMGCESVTCIKLYSPLDATKQKFHRSFFFMRSRYFFPSGIVN